MLDEENLKGIARSFQVPGAMQEQCVNPGEVHQRPSQMQNEAVSRATVVNLHEQLQDEGHQETINSVLKKDFGSTLRAEILQN